MKTARSVPITRSGASRGAVVRRERTRRQSVRHNVAQRQPFMAHLGLVSILCLVSITATWLPSVSAAPQAPPVQQTQAAAPGAPLLIVNKQNALSPTGFEPGDLVPAAGVVLAAPAAAALTAMIDAAASEGVSVTAVSGYRSFGEQTRLYSGYTGLYGQVHTDALSARPGFSEHQTGLAVDIGNPGGTCALQRCFAATPAGSWAAANAARFGFIIRYPEGAAAVTGYDYEPWHLRYVGQIAAADITNQGLTLEAYEGMPAAGSY